MQILPSLLDWVQTTLNYMSLLKMRSTQGADGKEQIALLRKVFDYPLFRTGFMGHMSEA